MRCRGERPFPGSDCLVSPPLKKLASEVHPGYVGVVLPPELLFVADIVTRYVVSVGESI